MFSYGVFTWCGRMTAMWCERSYLYILYGKWYTTFVLLTLDDQLDFNAKHLNYWNIAVHFRIWRCPQISIIFVIPGAGVERMFSVGGFWRYGDHMFSIGLRKTEQIYLWFKKGVLGAVAQMETLGIITHSANGSNYNFKVDYSVNANCISINTIWVWIYLICAHIFVQNISLWTFQVTKSCWSRDTVVTQ